MPDTSGPAFPIKSSLDADVERGLTKREWMAGMALKGLLGSPNRHERVDRAGEATNRSELVKLAYHYADAMLAQESQETP